MIKSLYFQLGPTDLPDGYEVCRIYKMRPHKAFGIDFNESEIVVIGWQKAPGGLSPLYWSQLGLRFT